MNRRFNKKLSSNDLGLTGTNQSGILVPKEAANLSGLFPRLNPLETNPRQTIRTVDLHTHELLNLEYIYYNGGTRDEFRLTRISSFLRKHRAKIGDILHFERESGAFWLSIERLLAKLPHGEEVPVFVQERAGKTWSIETEDTVGPQERLSEEEGGHQLFLSRRYERSRNNRKVAIEVHGRNCHVCGFSFDATYGQISNGYVEIHHLVPVSMMQGPRVLDPRVDLVPLCANCHRMVHRKWPPVPPEELRKAVLTEGD